MSHLRSRAVTSVDDGPFSKADEHPAERIFTGEIGSADGVNAGSVVARTGRPALPKVQPVFNLRATARGNLRRTATFNHSSSEVYSVLIAEGYPILERGIVGLVQADPRLQVVGAVREIDDAKVACQTLDPDVVIFNLALDDTFDLQQLAAICAFNRNTKVIALDCRQRSEYIKTALQAGVHGYIRIDASLDALATCILRVAEGKRYLAPCDASRLADSTWFEALSRRELAILRLVSTGKSNRDIGSAAGIAEETVKSHVTSILSKLGAANRTEAVNVAVRAGVIALA